MYKLQNRLALQGSEPHSGGRGTHIHGDVTTLMPDLQIE